MGKSPYERVSLAASSPTVYFSCEAASHILILYNIILTIYIYIYIYNNNNSIIIMIIIITIIIIYRGSIYIIVYGSSPSLAGLQGEEAGE